MYKVTHTYPTWEYGSKEAKIKKREDYFYTGEAAVQEVQEYAFQKYIENGKSKYNGLPIDLKKSFYKGDSDHPENTCAKVVLPQVRREAYYHERDLGNGLREINSSPAVILPEEIQEWKVEYFPTDPDIEKAANELIETLESRKKELEIVSIHKYTDSWVKIGSDIKLEDNTYPLSVLIRHTDPQDLENKKEFDLNIYRYSNCYRIVFYKKKGVLCVRFIRYGTKSALNKEYTAESSVTWYERMPTSHTNYLCCKENIDRILYLLEKDGKKIRKKIDSIGKKPKYRNKALNEAIVALNEHYHYKEINVQQEKYDSTYMLFVPEEFYNIFLIVKKEDQEHIYVGSSWRYPNAVININNIDWKDKFFAAVDEMVASMKD